MRIRAVGKVMRVGMVCVSWLWETLFQAGQLCPGDRRGAGPAWTRVKLCHSRHKFCLHWARLTELKGLPEPSRASQQGKVITPIPHPLAPHPCKPRFFLSHSSELLSTNAGVGRALAPLPPSLAFPLLTQLALDPRAQTRTLCISPCWQKGRKPSSRRQTTF